MSQSIYLAVFICMYVHMHVYEVFTVVSLDIFLVQVTEKISLCCIVSLYMHIKLSKMLKKCPMVQSMNLTHLSIEII